MSAFTKNVVVSDVLKV